MLWRKTNTSRALFGYGFRDEVLDVIVKTDLRKHVQRPAGAGFSNVFLEIYTRENDTTEPSISVADLDLVYRVNFLALSSAEVRTSSFDSKDSASNGATQRQPAEHARPDKETETEDIGLAKIVWASPTDESTSEELAGRALSVLKGGFRWNLTNSGQILHRSYQFPSWLLARRFFAHVANLAMAHKHEPMVQIEFTGPGDRTRVKAWWTTNFQEQDKPLHITSKDVELVAETHKLASSYGASGINVDPEEETPETETADFIWKNLGESRAEQLLKKGHSDVSSGSKYSIRRKTKRRKR